jgi:hypothetical protein
MASISLLELKISAINVMIVLLKVSRLTAAAQAHRHTVDCCAYHSLIFSLEKVIHLYCTIHANVFHHPL